MLRGIAAMAVIVVFIAGAMWYRQDGHTATEARQSQPVQSAGPKVRPNAELAEIFTQLEREWAQVGTAPVKAVDGVTATTGTQKGRTR